MSPTLPLSAEVPAAAHRACAFWPFAGSAGCRVRAVGADDPQLGVQAARDAGERHDGPTTAEQEELRRLRRENRQLREEREILAKGDEVLKSVQ